MNWMIPVLMGLVSLAALAKDYKVTHFEASDYRTFSMDEMRALLGPNAILIPQLTCNGKDEIDPWTDALRLNPLKDSLRIKVPKKEEYFLYQEGHFFDADGGEVTSFDDPFVSRVAKALLRFEAIAPTAKLLRKLESSHFPLMIALGQNAFNPQVPGGKFWSGMKMAMARTFLSTLRMSEGGYVFADIGSGGQILWNPNLPIESIEADGIRRPLDPDVALAHEMYHAFDSIRGMLDMGVVQGEGYEFESVVEYRAVWFENIIRRKLGIKLRKHYGDPWVPEGGDPANAPDLLDGDGNPIFIEAPCLDNL